MIPLEAIEGATRLPAALLGQERELGTIETGKLAAVVVLRADPLATIANTRKIVGVVADGRYFDEGDLHDLLDRLSPSTRGNI